MRKHEILDHWESLVPNQEIPVQPIPYGHTGTKYSEDTIRITGSQEFIDAVLSRLMDLLAYETPDRTRLQVSYQESANRETGEWLGSFNFYLQVHERGQR